MVESGRAVVSGFELQISTMIGMLRGLMSKDFLEVGELDKALHTLKV